MRSCWIGWWTISEIFKNNLTPWSRIREAFGKSVLQICSAVIIRIVMLFAQVGTGLLPNVREKKVMGIFKAWQSTRLIQF